MSGLNHVIINYAKDIPAPIKKEVFEELKEFDKRYGHYILSASIVKSIKDNYDYEIAMEK